MTRSSLPGSGKNGFVLPTVLWIAIALALIAAAVVHINRADERLARGNLQTAVASEVADAGITRGIAILLDRRANPQWRIDGTPKEWKFAGTTVRISIEDELGKIDLNTATDSILHGLLISKGIGEQQATALVDAIGDWRSTNGLRRLNGANAADYQTAGYPYGPRNAAFESVDELGQVIGMNAKLLDRLSPSLTVFSHRPMPDPNTAPPSVLAALSASGGVHAGNVASANASGSHVAVVGTTSSVVDLTGRAFTIKATAQTAQSGQVTRTAVVRFVDNTHFWIQSWQ